MADEKKVPESVQTEPRLVSEPGRTPGSAEGERKDAEETLEREESKKS